MSKPVAIVVCVYAAGILAADLLTLPLAVLLATGILLAVVGLLSDRNAILVCLLGVAGAANLTFRSTILSPHDVRSLVGEAPELITVRGTLRETPSQRVYRESEEESWRSIAELKLSAV